jgi:hypothetical protein
MFEEVKANISNPEVLEKLYRKDSKAFKAAFDKIYPEIESSEPAKYWKIRLEYDFRPEPMKTFAVKEIISVIAIGLIVAILIKIPGLFSLGYNEESFYMKNAALIVFFGLIAYTIRMNNIYDPGKMLITAISFLVTTVYVNLLPWGKTGDSVNLVYIHLPIMMWFIYGIIYTGFDHKALSKRISFIRHNGDLAIFYALIAIAGGILSGITIGLFEAIGLKIAEFYSKNIILTGAAAAPVVAAYLIEKFPALVNKTAPVIAGIFSPLVLLTLTVFLITFFVTGKDPYNDREFLLIFNLMLLGVMGIIIFSVSETSVIQNQKFNAAILFVLSIVTIIIDLIALSAIFYRLGEYGITPNRLAVLVSNILVLINLVLIMGDLFRVNFKKKEFNLVEKTLAKFMPLYLVWILIVVFGFPLIFGMK